MLDRILQVARGRGDPQVDRNRVKETTPVPGSLIGSLLRQGLGVIAEVKRRSPSRGVLNEIPDAGELARRYVGSGARAVSVLTEPEFFGGDLQDLMAVREAIDVPVLRKDFIIYPGQVWESRQFGADAVLLIVAALDAEGLSSLLGEVKQAQMEALVEVHDPLELERAKAAGAKLIGVNNRDLKSSEVDLSTAEGLGASLEGVECKVAESGIFSAVDAARMSAAGYDAVLVGEGLLTSTDPEALIREMTVT